jgi:phosphate transport system substrate-binding protein
MNRVKSSLRTRAIATAAAGVVLISAGVALASQNGTQGGGGSTFDAGIFGAWAQQTNQTYNGTLGSGTGIKNMIAGTLDWAGSDAPFSAANITSFHTAYPGEDPLYVSSFVGGISVPVHVLGVSKAIKLSGPVLAGIFDNTITQWNATAIKKLNPGVKLPSATIVRVVRSDSSGTSYNFENYLIKSSTAFGRIFGTTPATAFGTALQNLGGSNNSNLLAVKGGPSVASTIASTPYSIGYVDLVNAENIGYTNFAAISSTYKVGRKTKLQFVLPSRNTIGVAASRIVVGGAPEALQLSLLNVPVKNAYPIAMTSFAIGFSNYAGLSHDQAAMKDEFKRFVQFGLSRQGQALLHNYYLAPLPAAALAREKAVANAIK